MEGSFGSLLFTLPLLCVVGWRHRPLDANCNCNNYTAQSESKGERERESTCLLLDIVNRIVSLEYLFHLLCVSHTLEHFQFSAELRFDCSRKETLRVELLLLGQHKCQKATTAKHNKLAAVSKARVRASTHELRTLRAQCERERITIFIVAKNKSMQINYLLHFAGEHPPHSHYYYHYHHYYYFVYYYCVLLEKQLVICTCTNMFV